MEKMETRIAGIMVEALNSALSKWYFKGEANVRLCQQNTFFKSGKKLAYDVNWAALGDCTPEAAVEFAKNVKFAAALAAKINELDVEIDYDVENECFFVNGDHYNATVEKLVEWLEAKDIFNLMEFVGEGLIVCVVDEEVF